MWETYFLNEPGEDLRSQHEEECADEKFEAAREEERLREEE